MKNEFYEGQRVSVIGKQIFEKEDQNGTVISEFTTTVKVWLDNGKKFYVTKEYVLPLNEHL